MRNNISEHLGVRHLGKLLLDLFRKTAALLAHCRAELMQVENWRWSGTPFILRSGKRLPRRVTEVAIQFKQPPHLVFEGGKPLQPNVLLLRIQPDE
ncbi:MAG TPA: hypothetical protein VFV83_06685, partial [Chthoniobacteraceae bacterium]|nr:hypothetical protein [Chthoniobacteraceae bacterium]